MTAIHKKLETNFCDFGYYKNAFTDDLIKKLDDTVKECGYSSKKGRTGFSELGTDTDDYSTNNRDIIYMDKNPQTAWLYDFLIPYALDANTKLYNFDINIVTDPVHYVTYPTDGGHLDWHMDIGYGGVNKRKLAMTVQISNPSEYEGGVFEVWFGGRGAFVEVPREKGDILVFPAFLMHRVKPITKGQRKCLVFWTGSQEGFR